MAFDSVSFSAVARIRAALARGPTAARAPTNQDDSDHGYSIASSSKLAGLWPFGPNLWQITRDTPNAAVWEQIGAAEPTTAIATAPVAAYAVKRVHPAYTGPLFQIRRASDSATLDIAQTAEGNPNTAAIQAFVRGTTWTFSRLYEQVSGTLFMTVPATTGTVGGAAYLTAEPSGSFENLVGGVPAVVMAATLPLTGTAKTYQLLAESTLALTTNPMSIVAVAKFSSAEFGGGIARLGANIAAATTFVDLFYQQSVTAFGAAINGGSSTTYRLGLTSIRPATQPDVYGVSNGSTLVSVFHGDDVRSFATGTQTGAATAGIVLGGAPAGGGLGQTEIGALLVYNVALSAAEHQAVRAALTAKFALKPQRRNVIICDGDSITWGQGSKYIKGWPQRLQDVLDPDARVYNIGKSGDIIENRISAFSTLAAPLLVAGQKGYVLLAIGTNNIGPSTLQATGLYAQTGATVYSLITQYVANAKAAGFKVAVATLTARDTTGRTAGQIAEQAALDTLIRANAAGADAVVDLAADPDMGSVAVVNARVLFDDAIHPSDAGYRRIASVWALTVRAMLAA